MKKLILMLLSILTIVVVSSGCSYNSGNLTYSPVNKTPNNPTSISSTASSDIITCLKLSDQSYLATYSDKHTAIIPASEVPIGFIESAQPSTAVSTTSKPEPTTDPLILGPNGIYKNYYLGLVDDGGVLGGDGCYDIYGKFIVLINNKNATDPTYQQLINFLQQDKIDQYPYVNKPGSLGYFGSAESHVALNNIQQIIDGVSQPRNPYVCADFAERLHNDAELAGIKAAFVSISFTSSSIGHACNAFQTTDAGLIYIDDTGMSSSPHPVRGVKRVNIETGKNYIPLSVFPEDGWDNIWDSLGIVAQFKVVWDGTWNK